jgi:NDP-sugar pyrophosphorylase family protein
MINKPLVVLAGGFGSRLQSVLKGTPKPLADINGKPFLWYLLQNWVDKGFNDFIFSLHYESNKIMDFVESQKQILKDCNVRYSVEPVPMGTGGAISYLLENAVVASSFFVANADTWIDSGYSTLNDEEGNVIGVVEVEDTRRYGSVLVDDKGFIKYFLEKNNIRNSGLINAGIYKLSSSEFNKWDGNPYSLENDLFVKLIEQKNLKAKKIKSNFIDIGVPDDYYKFCKFKSI